MLEIKEDGFCFQFVFLAESQKNERLQKESKALDLLFAKIGERFWSISVDNETDDRRARLSMNWLFSEEIGDLPENPFELKLSWDGTILNAIVEKRGKTKTIKMQALPLGLEKVIETIASEEFLHTDLCTRLLEKPEDLLLASFAVWQNEKTGDDVSFWEALQEVENEGFHLLKEAEKEIFTKLATCWHSGLKSLTTASRML